MTSDFPPLFVCPFNYDSFVSFRAIGLMGYLRLTAGLMFCSCGFPHSFLFLPCGRLFLVPTLWETLSCPYPVGDSFLSLPCGRLFLVPTPWETLPSSTVGDRY